MIYGIGTDIVAVDRIKQLYIKYSNRSLHKILSSTEQNRFNEINNFNKKIAFIATRWAAKEALVKALGIGFRQGVYLSEITISNNGLGQPEVHFTTDAQLVVNNLLNNKKFKAHISLSDEREFVHAYVILEILD